MLLFVKKQPAFHVYPTCFFGLLTGHTGVPNGGGTVINVNAAENTGYFL
jgi:hypothetical protein